jgi:uncharacterized LabA/DUF88 family protein
MPIEPTNIRAAAFVDGQNLFHAAREAFGYTFPNYDPLALAHAVCNARGWTLVSTHFFTGVPDAADNPPWNHFWVAKLAVMGTRGVETFSRPLRYRNQTVTLKDGTTTTTLVGQEKGVDVRIALDVVRLARENAYDVALLFSQDQDLSEVADEVRAISREQGRWTKIAEDTDPSEVGSGEPIARASPTRGWWSSTATSPAWSARTRAARPPCSKPLVRPSPTGGAAFSQPGGRASHLIAGAKFATVSVKDDRLEVDTPDRPPRRATGCRACGAGLRLPARASGGSGTAG